MALGHLCIEESNMNMKKLLALCCFVISSTAFAGGGPVDPLPPGCSPDMGLEGLNCMSDDGNVTFRLVTSQACGGQVTRTVSVFTKRSPGLANTSSEAYHHRLNVFHPISAGDILDLDRKVGIFQPLGGKIEFDTDTTGQIELEFSPQIHQAAGVDLLVQRQFACKKTR